MPAHVEVTIKIPVDCDPVTAQRIHQLCEAVMSQFPGIDDAPQHPFRMFLTTLDVYQDRIDGKTPAPTVVEAQETLGFPEPLGADEQVAEMMKAYIEDWGNAEIDRADILRRFLVGRAGDVIRDQLEWSKNPDLYLVNLGATPEQASNLVAVGTAMQLIRL